MKKGDIAYDFDLDELEALADSCLRPDENGVRWTAALDAEVLKELVAHARAAQRHADERDLWQEIGRLKERLDRVEAT